jgi:hypothetical protein
MQSNVSKLYDKFSFIEDYRYVLNCSKKYITEEFFVQRGWNMNDGNQLLFGVDRFNNNSEITSSNTTGISLFIYGLFFENKYLDRICDLYNLLKDIKIFMNDILNSLPVSDNEYNDNKELFVIKTQFKFSMEKIDIMTLYLEPNTFTELIGRKGVMNSIFHLLPVWSYLSYEDSMREEIFPRISEVSDGEVENFEYIDKIKIALQNPKNIHFFARMAIIINNALLCKSDNGLDKIELVIKFIQNTARLYQIYYDSDGKQSNLQDKRCKLSEKRTNIIIQSLKNLGE